MLPGLTKSTKIPPQHFNDFLGGGRLLPARLLIRIQDVEADVSLQNLGNEAVQCAPAGDQDMQRPGTVRFLFDHLLQRVQLSVDAADAQDQLFFVFGDMGHTVSLRPGANRAGRYTVWGMVLPVNRLSCVSRESAYESADHPAPHRLSPGQLDAMLGQHLFDLPPIRRRSARAKHVNDANIRK